MLTMCVLLGMEASAPAFCHQLKSLQGEPEPLIGGPSNEWSIAQKKCQLLYHIICHIGGLKWDN